VHAQRKPLAAQTIACAIPVLPLVGFRMIVSGFDQSRLFGGVNHRHTDAVLDACAGLNASSQLDGLSAEDIGELFLKRFAERHGYAADRRAVRGRPSVSDTRNSSRPARARR